MNLKHHNQRDGTLKIIDRKKDLVKLQFGEYVSLGKVESQLKTHSLVENICLYGDPYRRRTVAIAVPSQEHLKALAKSNGIHSGSLEELCSSNKVYYLAIDISAR